MHFLIFGETGQVARELARAVPAAGHSAEVLGRDRADLRDPATCAAAVAATGADAVINAAAYTAVDAAETDAETARLVNAEAPGAMAAPPPPGGFPSSISPRTTSSTAQPPAPGARMTRPLRLGSMVRPRPRANAR